MKFIIGYGCDGLGRDHLAVEADSIEIASEYAYQSARSYREGYEGLHGCLDFMEFCEEEGYDSEDEDSYEAYEAFIENELEYWVEEYRESNPDHEWILVDCNGEFFNI